MGRLVKRVALDFEWPLNTVWKGYVMTDVESSLTCPVCEGSGLSALAKRLSEDWYDNNNFGVTWDYAYGEDPEGNPADRPPWRVIGKTRRWMYSLTQDEVDALCDDGRLAHYYRDFVPGTGWVDRPGATRPTAEQVNRDMQRGMGHDGINQWICVQTRFKRLYPDQSYVCTACEGEGRSFRDDAHRAAHEEWEPTDPPEGPGYQVWENTSEGSPISPVMEKPEELAWWCAQNNASIFGGDSATYVEWLQLIAPTDYTSRCVMRGSAAMTDGTSYPPHQRPMIGFYEDDGSIYFEVLFNRHKDKRHRLYIVAFQSWCHEMGIRTTEIVPKRDNNTAYDPVLGGRMTPAQALLFKVRWV